MASQENLHWDDGAGRWLDAAGNDPNAPTYTTGLTGRTKQELDDYWAGKGVSIANAGYVPPPATGAGSAKVDADEQAAALASYLARRAADIAAITARVDAGQASINAGDAAARNATIAAVAAAQRAENERVLRILSGSGTYTSDAPPVPPRVITVTDAPPAAPVWFPNDSGFIRGEPGPALVYLQPGLGDDEGDGPSPLVILAAVAVLAAGAWWYVTHGGAS